MRFFIEVMRPGPGMVFVTFRDGPRPQVNDVLRDEENDLWRATALMDIEVEMVPCGQSTKPAPKGLALVVVPAAAHAAA